MTPPHEHDLGLVHDLGVLRRRTVLHLLAGAGLAVVAGRSPDESTGTPSTSTSTASASTGTPSTNTGTPSTSIGNGKVTFTTIFPAAYSGRWPHIHFEVYASLSEATAAGKISATSQLALPEDVCAAVYATDGYNESVENMSRTSLDNDMVFRDDGAAPQLATVSGSVQSGYRARLTVGV